MERLRIKYSIPDEFDVFSMGEDVQANSEQNSNFLILYEEDLRAGVRLFVSRQNCATILTNSDDRSLTQRERASIDALSEYTNRPVHLLHLLALEYPSTRSGKQPKRKTQEDEDDENEKTPPLSSRGSSTLILATSSDPVTLDQVKLLGSEISLKKAADPSTLPAIPSEEIEVVNLTVEDDLPLARRKKRNWTETPEEIAQLKHTCPDVEGYIKAVHEASAFYSQSPVGKDLDSMEESAIFII
ncbi:hypothetical protein JCGZ_23926 [Jatropha curcas]|uniref:Uncharacterized protein n=1 Tax=Jatropha curcas TaxID=180498 RepID=A0A067JPA0_JATCU|nr:hypothetical protein JCGZ_23926 [Jatropha curcas]